MSLKPNGGRKNKRFAWLPFKKLLQLKLIANLNSVCMRLNVPTVPNYSSFTSFKILFVLQLWFFLRYSPCSKVSLLSSQVSPNIDLILRACFKMINNYKILICNLEISPERVSLNKCEPDPETRSINHLGVMEWGGWG